MIAANFDKLERCSKDREYFEGLSEREAPRFVYLDSSEPRRSKQLTGTMLSYFLHEFVERKLPEERTDDLCLKTIEELKHLVHVHNPYVPKQPNEVDGGLCLLHNVRCFLDNTGGFQDMCLDGLVERKGSSTLTQVFIAFEDMFCKPSGFWREPMRLTMVESVVRTTIRYLLCF